MLYAAIDIHKRAFQAAVLDPESGELVEERFSADRESALRWADEWRGRVEAVAIEATTGWRWVWRELARQGFDVLLAELVQTRSARTAAEREDRTHRTNVTGFDVLARLAEIPAGASPRYASDQVVVNASRVSRGPRCAG